MPIGRATITSKGRLTVPSNVRAALKLQVGDRVEFFIHGDGTVRFLAINQPVESLFGCVPYDGPPKTIEEIEEGIAEGAISSSIKKAGVRAGLFSPVD